MASDSRAQYDAGRAAWPDIALDEAAFARALGDDAVDGVHAAELYLACAAAAGHPVAIAAFERQYLARVPQLVLHMKLSADDVDELCQLLRELLLLGRDGQPPKLAEYAGRGSLAGWMRVVTVRAAVDKLRAERGHVVDLDEVPQLLAGDGDEPELELLRTRFQPRFAEALRVASGTLTARQRNLLRLSLVDGLTLEQMAPIFGVGKSTVHRWLEQARRHFQRRVRRFFHEELGISQRELDSVAGLLHSQIELSLSSLLRTR